MVGPKRYKLKFSKDFRKPKLNFYILDSNHMQLISSDERISVSLSTHMKKIETSLHCLDSILFIQYRKIKVINAKAESVLPLLNSPLFGLILVLNDSLLFFF